MARFSSNNVFNVIAIFLCGNVMNSQGQGDYVYVALDNGPTCVDNDRIKLPAECLEASLSLDYSSSVVVTGSWGHAPRGCFVGHNNDGWKNTFFNSQIDGQTGQARYRSICRQYVTSTTITTTTTTTSSTHTQDEYIQRRIEFLETRVLPHHNITELDAAIQTIIKNIAEIENQTVQTSAHQSKTVADLNQQLDTQAKLITSQAKQLESQATHLATLQTLVSELYTKPIRSTAIRDGASAPCNAGGGGGVSCEAPTVRATGTQVTISARTGDVQVDTATCGVIDLCELSQDVQAILQKYDP